MRAFRNGVIVGALALAAGCAQDRQVLSPQPADVAGVVSFQSAGSIASGAPYSRAPASTDCTMAAVIGSDPADENDSTHSMAAAAATPMLKPVAA